MNRLSRISALARFFGQPWIWAGASAVGFFAADWLQAGEAALSVGGIGLLVGCIGIALIARALLPALLIPQLIAIIFAVQGFWLFVNAALFGSTEALGKSSPLDIARFPVQATAPLLLVPVGSMVAAAVLRVFLGSRKRETFLGLEAGQVNTNLFSLYLVLGALLLIAYWPATLANEGFGTGYMVRVLYSSLFLFSVVAGRYTVGRARISLLWYLVLSVNVIIAILASTRSVAFLPPAYFAIGRILGTIGRQRRRWIALSIVSTMPALVASGMVGVIREQIGRGSDLITGDRVSSVYDATEKTVERLNGSLTSSRVIKSEGAGRMVVWTNPSVAILSPAIVPFRGTDSIVDEIFAYATVNVLSGRGVDEVLEAGLVTAPANQYGFTVNAETSVEFSIFADAWSRGGVWVCIVFGFVGSLILAMMEIAVHALRRIWPSSAMLLFCVVAGGAFEFNTYPLLFGIRTAVFRMVTFLAIALIFELMNAAVVSHTGGDRLARWHPTLSRARTTLKPISSSD